MFIVQHVDLTDLGDMSGCIKDTYAVIVFAVSLRRHLSSVNETLLERPLAHFSVVKLNNKSLLKLSGSDVYPFMQGIITNDMQCLEHDCTSLYAQLLTIKVTQ